VEVIAAPQFLLYPLILLFVERAWQIMLFLGDVIRDEQMSESGELLGPGEFLQDAA
jgi:hypothetical protein